MADPSDAPVGSLKLAIGPVSGSFTVEAEAATVQMARAERAGGASTSSQVDGLLMRGRYVMNMLELLPRVADLDSDAMDALQEVKALISNYQAESGRPASSTATATDCSSSGRRSFGRSGRRIPPTR